MRLFRLYGTLSTLASAEEHTTIWTDHETEIDLCNHRGIADTIVRLVREGGLSPLTIGVHGDWGSGKSSTLAMVRNDLAQDDRVAVLSFNGWLFQGFEDAKIALMESILVELERDKRFGVKVKEAIQKLLRRVDWLKLARKLAAGGLTIAAASNGTIPVSIGQQLAGDGGVLRDAEDEDVTRQIHQFREEFERLLADAEIKQLVVIVDDLDRCLPSTAIETLEALRLFLFVQGTVFIVAADEAMIEYSVRQHFPGLPYGEGPTPFTRAYLEKLIQVPFRLPSMSTDEARTYISLLFIEAGLRSAPDAFSTLLTELRKQNRTPWEMSRLDYETVTKILPSANISEVLREQLHVSEQVVSTLASGTKGNPRHIKRFLNTLMLRLQLAKSYGIADSVKEKPLAKLMLLERFYYPLYRALVEVVRASDGGKISAIDFAQTGDASPDLPEVLSASTSFYEWSLLEPTLANIDLRPYVFVSREHGPGFIGNAQYGDLPARLVKRVLDAGELEISSLEHELRNTGREVVEQIFDFALTELRGRGELRTVDGLLRGIGAVARTQPQLQPRLLELVESYPTDRVGAPIALYLRGAITDAPMQERLNSLLDRWAKQGSKMLAEATRFARKTRKAR